MSEERRAKEGKLQRHLLRDAGVWGLPKVKYAQMVDPWELLQEGKAEYARRLLCQREDTDGLLKLLERLIEEGDYFEAVAVDRELLTLTGNFSGRLDRRWHREMAERLMRKEKFLLALQAYEAAQDPEGAERARTEIARLLGPAAAVSNSAAEDEGGDAERPSPGAA
ncbi:MAG: hypothetical protein HYV63_02865 [Candidatus Schekmanbacteria bacterium]|nr:hypothetical protein [Candidatus Schekmanbacteria bacterium]